MYSILAIWEVLKSINSFISNRNEMLQSEMAIVGYSEWFEHEQKFGGEQTYCWMELNGYSKWNVIQKGQRKLLCWIIWVEPERCERGTERFSVQMYFFEMLLFAIYFYGF